ncbi:Transcription elongation factor B polypeptide 3, partial [Bienertia sinuspersici]
MNMMRSRQIHLSDKYRVGKGKAPSLLDLCVQTAIDNIRYIGNVGPVASDLLERILPHCTVEQLMHIENATSERDLSPETDKLWKKFYEAQFGARSVEMVVERMSKFKVAYNWRQLYQAKLKDQDEAKKKSVERLAQLYKTENARKQSRQIQICAKVPPSSKKRSFGGGFGDSSTFSSVKSSIMKKAKVEH